MVADGHGPTGGTRAAHHGSARHYGARVAPRPLSPDSPSPTDVRGRLDALLLATIEVGPVHGWGIIERLRDGTDGAVSLEGGTLYPALRRLEDSGLVTGEWTEVAGRRRRVYSLTAAGAAALHRERGAWRNFVRVLGSVLDTSGPALR